MKENRTEILMYQTEDGQTKIDVRMENETVWLSLNQMIVLFNSSKSNLSEHIKHIFDEGELDEEAVVRNFRTTASDGKVSFEQALEKAKSEYEVYKQKTADELSEIEKHYVKQLEEISKNIKDKGY